MRQRATYLFTSSLFFLCDTTAGAEAGTPLIGDLTAELLPTAVGVSGCCSSLLGVVVDEVGVGRAELRLLLFTWPMMGEEAATSISVGECSWRPICCPLLTP